MATETSALLCLLSDPCDVAVAQFSLVRCNHLHLFTAVLLAAVAMPWTHGCVVRMMILHPVSPGFSSCEPLMVAFRWDFFPVTLAVEWLAYIH